MVVRAEPALRALVLGAGGQDGSYLCELLLGRGYEVVGVVPDAVAPGADERVEAVEADLLDRDAVGGLLRRHRPDEIYHLAAPSFVPRSWEQPVETIRFVVVSSAALLEAVRLVAPAARVFQASSAEVFGEPAESPQTEATPRNPITPYGVAKDAADRTAAAFRRRYGLHVSCGILFNHESPRRGREFLPAKVAHGVAAIARGDGERLQLGDLEAERDWGFAPDYVDAMWRMLQRPEPDDYVVATGEAHSVRELVELAFAHAGLDWREHVSVDESLVRDGAAPSRLVGDASRARRVLGWEPTVRFEELVRLLVDAAAA